MALGFSRSCATRGRRFGLRPKPPSSNAECFRTWLRQVTKSALPTSAAVSGLPPSLATPKFLHKIIVAPQRMLRGILLTLDRAGAKDVGGGGGGELRRLRWLLPRLACEGEQPSGSLRPSLPRGSAEYPPTTTKGRALARPFLETRWFGDPWGNRTPVTAVKGRCLSRLTNGPGSGSWT